MKCQFFNVEKEHVMEVRKICKPGTCRTIPQSSIPSFISQRLKEKCHGAVVIASTCNKGDVYAILLQRKDIKDKGIDEMPCALVAIPNKAASSCLLHHADYEGRTTYPDDDFWEMVDETDIEVSIPLLGLPPTEAGPLTKIKGSRHEKGFLKAKTKIIQHDNALKQNKEI